MGLLVIGSRGSRLALRQAEWVAERLTALRPGLTCRIDTIKTSGDKMRDMPLTAIGGRGVFVKEIEEALLAGKIDVAVHCAKELPSEVSGGLCIAAFPERENPADALVSCAGTLAELPKHARVGTSSPRRKAQLLHARPDIEVVELRGNLDTRMRKLAGNCCDALVLACAGMVRLGWESRILQVLPYEVCLPAVGQGALAIQCRTGDPACEIVGLLDDGCTRRCVTAERAFLAGLGGGCLAPIAALATEADGKITLETLVAAPDGSRVERRIDTGEASEPAALGAQAAQWFLESPARELLEQARGVAPRGMGAA